MLLACSGKTTDEVDTHARDEPALLSSNHADEPSALEIAMNPAGDALVLWSDHDPTESELRAARYTPGAGWEPTALITSGTYLSSSRIAIDENGHALATWTQEAEPDRSTVFASRFTIGAGWSAPERLEQDPAVSPTDVALSMNPQGHALAVWSDIYTSGVFRARFFEPGVGWGPVETIGSETTNSVPAYEAGVVLCNDGSAVALWAGYSVWQPYGTIETQIAKVYLNRYDPSTGWSGAEPYTGGPQSIQNGPQLRCDAEGHVTAIWSAPAHPQMATLFARDDAAGNWSGDLLHLGSSAAKLTLDGAGDAMVVLNNSFQNGPVEAYLHDAAQGLVEQRAIEDHQGDSGLVSLDLASNDAGQARAVWARDTGTGDDIWTNTRDPDTGWGEAERLMAEVPTCTDTCFTKTSPRIAIDAAGNALVAWTRRHDSHADVVALVLPR